MEASSTGFTSLDPTETNSHVLGAQSDAQHRIHRHVWKARIHAVAAFAESGEASLVKRADRLKMCCCAPVLCIEQGLVPVLSPGRCRDRLCPTCARQRGHVAREKIRKHVLSADSVRLVTLTRRPTSNDLGTQIDALFAAFAKLRRHAAWKACVKGGLFVCETTHNAEKGAWHAHLHVLVEGTYFAQKVLADAWSTAVGEASVVDIRACHSRIQAANYVTKYVTKGADTDQWPRESVCAYALGIHRRRLYGAFGKWHKCKPEEDPADVKRPLPRSRLSVSQLLRLMRTEAVPAQETALALAALGSICKSLVREFLPTGPVAELPISAARYEQLTLFGLEILDELPPPPTPPQPPPREDTHTMRLWSESAGRKL